MDYSSGMMASNGNKEAVETQESWSTDQALWLPPTYRNIPTENLLENFYEGSILHKYSFIFYSCILISSGNEIGPVSNTEAWLASAYMVLGLVLTGVILGNISDSIENMNEEETEFERKIDELQVTLKQNKIPETVQEKILVYMQFCHQENAEHEDGEDSNENSSNSASFSYMPKILRKEFLFYQYENLQTNISLFSELDRDSIFEIISYFKTVVFLPDDVIVSKGEPCKEFFFIKKGRVRVLDEKGEIINVFEEGEAFNELSFVFDSIVLYTVVADDFCILDSLQKEDYQNLIEDKPDLVKTIKQGLKNSKVQGTNEIVELMSKIPFFESFTKEELKHFFKEYVELLYLNPNTLLTAPSSRCHALYFLIQGTVSRFDRSDRSYDYVKMRLLDEEETVRQEYDTFIQQVDILEQQKELEETECDQVLNQGDWLGSKLFLYSDLPLSEYVQNYHFDLTESFCELIYITTKVYSRLKSEFRRT